MNNNDSEEIGECLNAYRILNLECLTWSVSTVTIVPVNGVVLSQENRGKIKDIAWQIKKNYKNLCPGMGFIIDLDEKTVVVPSTWKFPQLDDFDNYRITPGNTFLAQANVPEHQAIIAGILKECIKLHFKEIPSETLGQLWQDYNNFCQMPTKMLDDQDVIYCREFYIAPVVLRSGDWSLKMEVFTKSLDSRSIEDYYRNGEINLLAEKIQKKRANRLTRDNLPSGIRVWHYSGVKAEILELENPDEIFAHANLKNDAQKALAGQSISCLQFKKPSIAIPLRSIRLILDSQIAQEAHGETIIEPQERAQWYTKLRDYFHGMKLYGGKSISLAETPLSIRDFPNMWVMPPDIIIHTSPDHASVFHSSGESSIENALTQRARQRNHYIRDNGYLIQRPINPLLAWPKRFGQARAERMQSDLNWSLKRQGLTFQFDRPLMYNDVHEIVKAIENGQYDTLLAVLPESEQMGQSDNDSHEKIKKQVEVPSQCIYYDNTLPEEWIKKSWKNFRTERPRQARRIEDHYQQCILNLLVKDHWVPFAPAEPFHYNVHIGIDVGGRHDNRVMACIGYGFEEPSKGLIFLPKEIEINSQKAEPIPTDMLFQGLLTLIEELNTCLLENGLSPDFSKVLIFRDGQFRGEGNAWNEIQAIHKLYGELKNRGIVDVNSRWTAVEISKRAEYWRLIDRSNSQVNNPIVGRCVFPFDDNNTAIVCTTGRPYLTQGTASPLLVKIINVYGDSNREEVLKDLIWEADMCYTKLDTGMSLPWVLHVADSGALQQSKAYKISGITV